NSSTHNQKLKTFVKSLIQLLIRMGDREKKCPLWLGDNHKKGMKGGGNQYKIACVVPVRCQPIGSRCMAQS
ncbi:MAG: hypothetical protein KUF76_20255, partial [Candidatus Thiodiazotropha sp. (ex Codakia orbicularis)]|nr:hypothetical protein [Candidatus Thiodiazotropha sp. (ex Codakia orbicularis)]